MEIQKIYFVLCGISVLCVSSYFSSSPSLQSPTESPRAVETTSSPFAQIYKERQFIDTNSATSAPLISPSEFNYLEATSSCGPSFGGSCINARSGPGSDFPAIAKLRTGMVLHVEGEVINDDKRWYKVNFESNLRYPERVTKDWYVLSDVVAPFKDTGEILYTPGMTTQADKHILVDVSNETLYAYEGDKLFMQEKISTGLHDTPTKPGTYYIFKKTPSRYMQGPTPGSDQVFDLPGVPWTMYFSDDGAAIHGAYWHDHFGEPWSHGCINLPPEKAKELYQWAEISTPVTIVGEMN